jgi:GNAT superfamily N-acetyltransferase
VGVVMLSMPSSETGPFRGVVEKLLVHKAFRGRGGARTLISALEAEATKRGRTILVSSMSIVTILTLALRHVSPGN